jgi:hypothetical protein
VTGEGKRLIAALAAAALAAGFLSACGDSDSNSNGGSTTTEAGARETGDGPDGSSGDGNGGGGKGDSGDDRTAFDGYERAEVETPLEVSGGGSEQFRVKGGDNSIQEYGEEADESELQEVAEIVHGFYVARAAGEWEKACSYLSAGLREQLEQLGAKSEVKGCGPFLEAFTTKLSPSVWREITTVDAASVRHDGEQAFLIYRGAGKEIYAMPLHDEDGEWKVTALSATTLG